MAHKSLEHYLTEARAAVDVLDTDAAHKEIEAGLASIDVRDKHELTEQGCIPGAIHASRGMLEFLADPASPYHDKRLNPGMKVLVYCASGGRSVMAAARLKEMGYDAVNLDGGFKAWVSSGKQVADFS